MSSPWLLCGSALHHCAKIPEKINLKGGNFCFGSLFLRVLSMVGPGALVPFDEAEQHGGRSTGQRRLLTSQHSEAKRETKRAGIPQIPFKGMPPMT
jgi:hypothetical protein